MSSDISKSDDGFDGSEPVHETPAGTPMTLCERLRNPAYVGLPNYTAMLHLDYTRNDMREAATRIEVLLAALKEAERFLDYLANDRTIFVGPGTPLTALAKVQAAIAKAQAPAPTGEANSKSSIATQAPEEGE